MLLGTDGAGIPLADAQQSLCQQFYGACFSWAPFELASAADCAAQREVSELASSACALVTVYVGVGVHERARTRNGRAGHIRSHRLRYACCARSLSIQHRSEGTVGDALHCGKWQRLLAPQIYWGAYMSSHVHPLFPVFMHTDTH